MFSLDITQKEKERISLAAIKLETDPKVWKDLVFSHLKLFPNVTCSICLENNCFSCGSKSHSTACSENLSLLFGIDGKSCPKCNIYFSREEGCNKMECSYCGHTFCWECLNAECGFYKCSTTDKVRVVPSTVKVFYYSYI